MNNLLDEIVTKEKTYHGVIDYTNKKHIILFDTTKNDTPEIVLLILSWKLTNPDMRFSVYKDIFFPDIKIPIIMMPTKNILSPLPVPEEVSIKKRSIRKKSVSCLSY